MRNFWISWIDGRTTVGAGFRYGYRILAEAKEHLPYTKNAMAVYGTSSQVDWEFETFRSEYATLETSLHALIVMCLAGEHVYMRADSASFDNWMHMYPVEGGYWFYFQVCLAL